MNSSNNVGHHTSAIRRTVCSAVSCRLRWDVAVVVMEAVVAQNPGNSKRPSIVSQSSSTTAT